jgi:biotin synthase
MTPPSISDNPEPGHWATLADRVLAGTPIQREEALAILEAPDTQLLEVLSAAYRIRFKWFGNQVQLYFLMNAKSGLCQEDCGYCSQSKNSDAEIPKYNLLDRKQLMAGAQAAADRQAGTYCIVISGRSPTDRELRAVETLVPEIKSEYNLKICACLGLLDDQQAQRLKAAGVDRVNHNLNTSETFYEDICTTHTYQDRVDTLHAVRNSGMELCSGGIIGMGEDNSQVVDMAFELRDLNVQSIPLNFLNSIEGTALESVSELTPTYCLKALAMFRFVNPDRELRIAGGRELNLGSLQPLGLYPANSIFVGDYLTTKGQAPAADYQMIKDLGFEVLENRELATTDG